jgi:hypothetical protein
MSAGPEMGVYELYRSALDSASGNPRTARQFEPEEKEQKEHRARSHRDSLEKAENCQIQAHLNIVRRLRRRNEITTVIIPVPVHSRGNRKFTGF